MSKIDVSKCDYYFQGRCGVSKNINYSIGCYANDCYYKQLQEVMNNLECAELRNKYDKEKFDSELQQLKAENEQLKEELSTIQHNCSREGCKYYDDDTFKVFYECTAQKALQLSANSVTTKYCDLLKIITEIKEIAEKESFCDSKEILQLIKQAKEGK